MTLKKLSEYLNQRGYRMPEYVVKFQGTIKAPDRLTAWNKAKALAEEYDLMVLSVSTELTVDLPENLLEEKKNEQYLG